MLQPVVSRERSAKRRGTRHIAIQQIYLRPCEVCGDKTFDGRLCRDCADRAHPHREGDPYDDLGGRE